LKETIMEINYPRRDESNWSGIYILGAVTALCVVAVALTDIVMTFLPGGSAAPGSLDTIGWFGLLREMPFMALRNLGLFNIINVVLAIPLYAALYGAHRRASGPYAALAATLFFIGAAIYIADNSALSLLALSRQYAAAMTDAQRSLLVASGTMILTTSEDLTAGTFIGFLLTEVAGIAIALIMLRAKIFNRATGVAGVGGAVLLLIFNTWTAFVPTAYGVPMMIGMVGGICTMAFYIMTAMRLLGLRHERAAAAPPAPV
jgi:hypothetical protein